MRNILLFMIILIFLILMKLHELLLDYSSLYNFSLQMWLSYRLVVFQIVSKFSAYVFSYYVFIYNIEYKSFTYSSQREKFWSYPFSLEIHCFCLGISMYFEKGKNTQYIVLIQIENLAAGKMWMKICDQLYFFHLS